MIRTFIKHLICTKVLYVYLRYFQMYLLAELVARRLVDTGVPHAFVAVQLLSGVEDSPV